MVKGWFNQKATLLFQSSFSVFFFSLYLLKGFKRNYKGIFLTKNPALSFKKGAK